MSDSWQLERVQGKEMQTQQGHASNVLVLNANEVLSEE
jgi:hypothetical protein